MFHKRYTLENMNKTGDTLGPQSWTILERPMKF